MLGRHNIFYMNLADSDNNQTTFKLIYYYNFVKLIFNKTVLRHTLPSVIEIFPTLTLKTRLTTLLESSVVKVIPNRIVKAEIARTSSILAAAITRVGIPLATPYPCS